MGTIYKVAAMNNINIVVNSPLMSGEVKKVILTDQCLANIKDETTRHIQLFRSVPSPAHLSRFIVCVCDFDRKMFSIFTEKDAFFVI